MAKNVSIDIGAPIQWPACCARCGGGDNLTTSRVSIGSVSSIGLGTVTSTLATLNYPVCREHAGAGLGMAAFLTRRTAGLSALRGFTYFTAVLGVVVFITLAARAVGLAAKSNLPPPWAFLGIFAGAMVLAAYFIYAFRTLPVRLIGQARESVTIRFANDAFATRFIAQNKRNLREVPWFKRFVI